MVNLVNEKVVAIVPALNEEETIEQVLKVLLDSNRFDEIIVVDGASSDRTVQVSEEMGVRVIKEKKREGKGAAMRKGIKSTDAEIIVFFDADLKGLNKNHVASLIDPVLEKKVVMCTGERDHYRGLPYFIANIDPLSAIGGERAIKRFVLESIPEKFIKNFAVETALNYYCLINNLPTALIELKGLKLVPKEKKWGVTKGLFERIREIWQLIKIRLILLFNKNEFVQKKSFK